MSKRMAPLSVRLSPELKERLEEVAERVHISKHTLAQEAIEAAVEAIEKNDFRLVMPIRFEVTHVPVEKAAASQTKEKAQIAGPERNVARQPEKKIAQYPKHTERTEIIHEQPGRKITRKEDQAGLSREEQQ